MTITELHETDYFQEFNKIPSKQAIFHYLWNHSAIYNNEKSPLLVSILCQLNSINIHPFILINVLILSSI
jgi:hypothetical protein